MWDQMKDDGIHCNTQKHFQHHNFVDFNTKLRGFEQYLGYKYPNMLHPQETKNAPNTDPVEILENDEDRSLTIDDIENAPEDPEELFSEPPLLDLDFDEVSFTRKLFCFCCNKGMLPGASYRRDRSLKRRQR